MKKIIICLAVLFVAFYIVLPQTAEAETCSDFTSCEFCSGRIPNEDISLPFEAMCVWRICDGKCMPMYEAENSYCPYWIQSTRIGACDNWEDAAGLRDGKACTNDYNCFSGNCEGGICCDAGKECCVSDNDCSNGYCEIGKDKYYCEKKRGEGRVCSKNSNCTTNFCLEGVCREPDFEYCGNGQCAEGENCSTCEKDCNVCDGGACNKDEECVSGSCNWYCSNFGLQGTCRTSDFTCCGDKECNGEEKCDECVQDCGVCVDKANGEPCTGSFQCTSGYCLNSVCRPQGYTWCGDKTCQEDELCSCSDCVEEAKCENPVFDYIISWQNKLRAGMISPFAITIDNLGRAIIKNIKLEINLVYPSKTAFTLDECREKTECVISLDDIGPGETGVVPMEKIGIDYKKPGRVEMDFIVSADNEAGSETERVSKNEWKDIPAVNLHAIFLPSNVIAQSGEMDYVTVGLQALDDIDVDRKNIIITAETEDESIVDVVSDKEVKYRLVGYNYPRNFTFYLDPRRVGYTNMTISFKGDNIEPFSKNIPITVLADPPVLEITAPKALIMEKGETKEFEFTVKNIGEGLAYRPKIEVESQEGIYQVGHSETYYLDSLAKNDKVTKKISIHAKESGAYKFKIITRYAEEPAEPHLANDNLIRTHYINVGVDDIKLVCVDEACTEQVECLVDLSNYTQCSLEAVDVIPYVDKPIAVVLAGSDFCEVKKRVVNLDPIGASLTSLLAIADFADNAADVAPGPGNVAGVVADSIEGTFDCFEGFAYDLVDKYCASGSEYGGYTGCIHNQSLFAQLVIDTSMAIAMDSEATQALYDAYEEVEAMTSVLLGKLESPVSFRIVDNNGEELGPRDGVVIIDKGELKLFVIKNPEKLENGYNVKLIGTDTGTFSLRTAVVDSDGVVGEHVLENQPVARAQSQSVSLAVQEKDGEITGYTVADEEIEKTSWKDYLWLFVSGGIVLLLALALLVWLKKDR